MKLKIAFHEKTGNSYSPYRRVIREEKVERIRAYKYSGMGTATVNYEAFVEGEWRDFMKKDQSSTVKRKLPTARQLQWDEIPKLVKVRSTASSSGYKYLSKEVPV